MAVDDLHMPVEGFPFVLHGVQAGKICDLAAGLVVVAVGEHDEITGLLLCRRHGRLPDHALLLLAVAHDDVDMVVYILIAAAHGHAQADGDAVSKRAGHRVHAGDLVHIGVPLEKAAQGAQSAQFFNGEVAPAGQRRVKYGAGMAFGKDETVTLYPAGVLRIQPQLLKKQYGHNVRNGHARAGMSVARGVYRFDHIQAQTVGHARQFFDSHLHYLHTIIL